MRKLVICAIVVMVIGSFIGCSKDTEPTTEATVEKDTRCFKVLQTEDALIFIEEKLIDVLQDYYIQIEEQFADKSGIYTVSIVKCKRKYPERGRDEYWVSVRGSANGEHAAGLGYTLGEAVNSIEWHLSPLHDVKISFKRM